MCVCVQRASLLCCELFIVYIFRIVCGSCRASSMRYLDRQRILYTARNALYARADRATAGFYGRTSLSRGDRGEDIYALAGCVSLSQRNATQRAPFWCPSTRPILPSDNTHSACSIASFLFSRAIKSTKKKKKLFSNRKFFYVLLFKNK